MAPRRSPRRGGRPAAVDPAAGNDAAPRMYHPTAYQFEKRLLRKLSEFYAAALVRLADLGHSAEASLDAVLHSGHSYGTVGDPVSNIISHTTAYLSDPGYAIGMAGGHADLRRLAKYSLAGLVCLLQSGFPTLTRVDAYSLLLSSRLNLERAMSLASKGPTAPIPAEVEELPAAVAETAHAPVPAEVEELPPAVA